jgi:hypothetical protein
MGEMKNVHKILVGKEEGKNRLVNQSDDGNLILKLSLKEIIWKLYFLIYETVVRPINCKKFSTKKNIA